MKGKALISAAWCVASPAIADAVVIPPEEAQAWSEAISACLHVVTTGDLQDLDGWALTDVGNTTVRLSHGVWTVGLDVLPPAHWPDHVATICATTPGSNFAGNEGRGRAVRALLTDIADADLSFHAEDQRSFPDVWRGCTFDGRSFYLKSVTQMTSAYFHFDLAGAHVPCAQLGV
ncbi:hypothetical protein JANAI62_32850 [Jannaschia pagri]|uniref:Uncharacterized protein n=1 Tax=Jannaschia pagri TaxID=2829797 RepID=A0ABQ4NQK2_9RHOB|nr:MULTISPECIES: hypothetical protein [unclassified Jannaschia]GIT92827.1 hypothetical protein JANAI61_32850 [Jannaschia sp. AI_61]GIT96662.1 hypothetical protein JANAI62_32850 [Jannaschia sp. AI_62]